jgi:hypothetical protein
MASKELVEIIKRAESLSPGEQMDLVAYLVEKARQAHHVAAPRRLWRELFGVAPYPLLGEDAQAWVSRTRREGDAGREQQWRDSA